MLSTVSGSHVWSSLLRKVEQTTTIFEEIGKVRRFKEGKVAEDVIALDDFHLYF